MVITKLLGSPDLMNISHSIQGTKDLLPTDAEHRAAEQQAAAVFAALQCSTPRSEWAAASVWGEHPAWTLYPPYETAWSGKVNDQDIRTSIKQVPGRTLNVGVATKNSAAEADLLSFELEVRKNAPTTMIIPFGGTPFNVHMDGDSTKYWLHLPHATFCITNGTVGDNSLFATSKGSGVAQITSPLPGKIAAVAVQLGAIVEAGAIVVVLDSMKMEHPIRAPITGTVTHIPVAVGSLVQSGELVTTLTPLQEPGPT
jgi:acetyl/propionyl-CoA carboxylase alpha subunit